MKLFKFAKTFARDEDGAVTVDWVVLTAAIVGLGIAVIASIGGSVRTLGQGLADDLAGHESTVTDFSAEITGSAS